MSIIASLAKAVSLLQTVIMLPAYGQDRVLSGILQDVTSIVPNTKDELLIYRNNVYVDFYQKNQK